MRRSFVVVCVLFLLAGAMAQEPPWFDMHNCAICKNLMAEPGLMDHFTKWEHYKTANGMLNLSVVDKEYVPAYKKACANIDATIAKFGEGEMPYLCGSCIAFGEIMEAGAKYEEFESDNIFMSTLTSEKPEVIQQIHAWVDRTHEEMAKMEQMEKQKKK